MSTASRASTHTSDHAPGHIPEQMLGQFELLVKVYDEGVMSQHLNSLSVGDTADFKHVPKNVKVGRCLLAHACPCLRCPVLVGELHF